MSGEDLRSEKIKAFVGDKNFACTTERDVRKACPKCGKLVTAEKHICTINKGDIKK
jgi:hypothetical protein